MYIYLLRICHAMLEAAREVVNANELKRTTCQRAECCGGLLGQGWVTQLSLATSAAR